MSISRPFSRHNFPIPAILAFATLAASSLAYAEAPKNIILIVGDGMGYEQTRMARYFNNGTNSLYNFEQFANYAIMTHDNVSGGTTDSAASATALATGTKVANSVISYNTSTLTDITPTLLESFKAAGKSTGLVTTSYMTDATPAGFGAHAANRSDSANIAADYFTSSQPNVLFGAAATGFSVAAAQAVNTGNVPSGYTTVTDRATMQALITNSVTHVAGIFPADGSSGGLGYYGTNPAYYTNNPRLEEMATTALDILDNNTNGFFLLLENENTDGAAHANSRTNSVAEVDQLAKAVNAALTWAQNRTDTLIVVLADHETGGLSFSGYPATGVLPTVNWSTTGHTKSPVPVYATGPNSQLFTGKIDNAQFVSLATAANNQNQTRYFREGQNGNTLDTFLQENPPDANDATNGTADKLIVDASDISTYDAQALIRFTNLFGNGPGQIPLNATITSAFLTVHTGAVSGDESPDSFAINRLLTNFDESTTWSTTNGMFGSDIVTTPDDSGLIPDLRSEMLAFNVTASLQAWLAGADNFGWLISTLGTNGWQLFSSEATDITQRPLLSVSFTVPLAEPIPEPATLTLLSLAALPLFRRPHRRR